MTQQPTTREDLVALRADYGEQGLSVRPVGGGTRSQQGPADFQTNQQISTRSLDRLIAYEPEDLTITVEAGMTVSALMELASDKGQSWPQAGLLPDTTVGGVLAGAVSGLSRLRFGPVRDSLLQVVIATGDGRLVTAGGRTVKGVAGYDLPRMMTGSLGSLGVIVEATLKLWPKPPARAWYRVDGEGERVIAAAECVMATTHRPGAVILTDSSLLVELVGPPEDVVAPQGFSADGPPTRPVGIGLLKLGVPPTQIGPLSMALRELDVPFAAQIGVGVCHVGVDIAAQVRRVREVATRLGGHAVIDDAPPALREEPWGPPPPGLEIMRRLKQSFDPHRILNPGLMPGGI